jgi:hypothetical protein
MMNKKLILRLNIVLIFLLYVVETTALSQEVMANDDFSDPSSGWDTFSDDDGSAAYQDGCLCIKDTTNLDKTTKSCFDEYFSDFVLDVDTRLVEGTDDNWHVIYCRLEDLDNNYGFGISSDGYYAMDKWVDGERTIFIGPAESEYIKAGRDVVNHIRIKCIGSDLSFYVNGHLLGKVSDSSHEGGNICLSARSFTGTFTEIAYDNFVVTEPA